MFFDIALKSQLGDISYLLDTAVVDLKLQYIIIQCTVQPFQSEQA